MRTPPITPFALVTLVAACGVIRRSTPTPIVVETTGGGAFVTTLGSDTTAIESYTRTGNVITGDLVQRQGGTVINHYVLTLNPDGTPAKLELTVRKPDGSVVTGPNAFRLATATYGGDTTTTVIMRDTTITRRLAAAHPYAVVGGGIAPSLGILEAALAHMRAVHADSVALLTLPATAQRTAAPSWVKFSGDSARIWSAGYVQYVTLDKTGHVVGLSGRETTQKIEVRRVPSLDVMRLAAIFAAADAAGRGLVGAASARDSVRAVVGRAHVSVDYFRPLARGRDVFSNGVLGDTIWRTGANNATMFKTDADLVIGDKTIPAGSYTLWTHVPRNNSSYELIVNKQTGQWGTEYHPDQDLLRVPLRVSRLPSLVDAFQIAIEPTANGGIIRLRWANTELSTPFTVK